MGIIEKKVLRSQNYHHSICGSFNSKNPEWGWNPPSVRRSPAIIFEWSKFLTFKFGEFFDIIIPYPFFFRQKLKHKLQWQSLMPILTWMIPTKNTKNARNKFWAKEWKIRWVVFGFCLLSLLFSGKCVYFSIFEWWNFMIMSNN